MSFEDITRQLEATDRSIDRARDLVQSGQLNRAQKLYRSILNDVVELYGADSLKTCNCLIDLADIAYAQERYAEVIMLIEQVIVTDNRASIFTAEQLLSVHFKLARAFEKSNNINEAYGTLRDLLEQSEKVLGPSNPFTARVKESLVSLCKRNSRKLRSAEKVIETMSDSRQAQFSTNQKLKASFARESADHRAARAYVPDGAAVALRRTWGRSITLASAFILCMGFLISGLLQPTLHDPDQEKAKSSAFEANAGPSLAAPSGSLVGLFVSTDGIKSLNVADNGQGVLSDGGVRTDVKVTRAGAEVYATSDDSRHIFRNVDQSLVDESGARLYKDGAPELSTVQVIKNVAVTLNRYYKTYGRYPQSQAELQSLRENVAYTNPLNDRACFPRLMNVIEKRGSSMTLDEYNNASNIVGSLMSLSGTMGEPCGVELYVSPYSSSGETVIVRGYDHSGSLLPCSTPGRCYCVVLAGGSVR